MAGLDPAVHAVPLESLKMMFLPSFLVLRLMDCTTAWMAGSSPAMTNQRCPPRQARAIPTTRLTTPSQPTRAEAQFQNAADDAEAAMRPRYRVFLSAVTSECGEARKLVASDLRSRGLEVKVQEDFRQEPGENATTLKKLHDYVKECDRVVAIMGGRSGSFPPADAAAPFKNMLPDGFDRASMTQWEVHFAREFGKRMSIYVASVSFAPAIAAAPSPDDDLQARLRDYLFKRKGLDRSPFDSPADLSRQVLKERWPDYSRPPPKSDRFVSIGDLFKGRDEAMERLRLSLEQGGRTAVTARAQALYGMGGLGKTRLAIEYGLAHEKDYSALLFLSGETPAVLEASLQGLASVLDIPDREDMKEDARRRAVFDWLRENPGWSLVIDNVDAPEALKAAEGLLSNLSRGHMVVTSRLANFPGVFEPLELDVLDEKASVEYLKARSGARRRPTPTDDADAVAISKNLDGLALALEQAAAYIAVKRKSFADYRADWERQRGQVLGWHSDAITGYPRSVADAMLLSMAQVSPAGGALLQHLAFLAPEPVPEALLATPIPGFTADAVAALEEIDGYSLIKRQADATFTMHRLVQDVVRRGLTLEEADARCVAVLSWLTAEADPARHKEVGERRAALLSVALHAEAAEQYAQSGEARNAAGYLLAAAGEAFVETGFLATAERLLRKAMKQHEALAKSDPANATWQRELSVSYGRIGEVLVAQGDLSGALKSFCDTLAIQDRLAKSDPSNAGWQRDLSVSYSKIGDVLVAQGDLTGALNSYRNLLAITERLAKSDPGNAGRQYDLGISIERVGDVQMAQGDLNAALTSYQARHAIISRLATSDPGNVGWQRDLSVSYIKIGEVLVAEGDLAGALKFYRDSLAIADRLAQSDPGNAGWQRDLCVGNERIGDLYAKQGESEEARKAFERALAIYGELIARGLGDVQSQVFSVAPLLRLAELDPARAGEYLEGALAILKPLAAGNRLDANRLAWIPHIEAHLAALKK
jgi:tetratricopeptide (TPR) repeat protein